MAVTADMSEPHKLSELSPDPTLQEAVPVLARLVREPGFLDSYILPLVEQAERAEEDWYVAHCCEDEDGSYSLQIFVWPPGSKTQVHDHSSWGAFCCVVGSLWEERYERLDHGVCWPDHARLRMLWRRVWKREDGVSTLLPPEGGIHRVGNPSGSKAISAHLYGPRTGDVDGWAYDPSRGYVCDRRESEPGHIEVPLLERMGEVLDGVTIQRLPKRIASVERPGLRHLILGFPGANSLDAVAIDTLEELMEDRGSQVINVYVGGMKGPVRDYCKKADWPQKFGLAIDHFSIEDALEFVGEGGSSGRSMVPKGPKPTIDRGATKSLPYRGEEGGKEKRREAGQHSSHCITLGHAAQEQGFEKPRERQGPHRWWRYGRHYHCGTSV